MGNVQGGNGNGSGGIQTGGAIGRLEIVGSLIGGSSAAGIDTFATSTVRTGYVNAGRIAQMVVDGNVESGSPGYALVDSGVIRARNDIASLVIKGTVQGETNSRVVISAGNNGAANPAIGNLTIGGNVSDLDLLAGYSGNGTNSAPLGTASNADAQIGTVMIKGNVFETNIVAGATAGIDGRFGTADDVLASGSGVTDLRTVLASIAKVVITGTILPNDQDFGIVAQSIRSISVSGAQIPLNPGPLNDLTVELAPVSNFFANEV
jgi:hypothetical protein